jgi:hypothetical protein
MSLPGNRMSRLPRLVVTTTLHPVSIGHCTVHRPLSPASCSAHTSYPARDPSTPSGSRPLPKVRVTGMTFGRTGYASVTPKKLIDPSRSRRPPPAARRRLPGSHLRKPRALRPYPCAAAILRQTRATTHFKNRRQSVLTLIPQHWSKYPDREREETWKRRMGSRAPIPSPAGTGCRSTTSNASPSRC